MKINILFIPLFILSIPALGQLNADYNHFRPGDVLVKQQVEYKDPGESGQNQLWDFSKLKNINEEYTLTYSSPPLQGDSIYILGDAHFYKKKVWKDELVIATEHNTMYYYHLSNDSLLQLGHENSSIKLTYTKPMVMMHYPLDYGQTIFSNYQTKGLYSETVPVQSFGNVLIMADSYGKMILPTGDTINSVLRVKTTQTIMQPNGLSNNIDINSTKGSLLETYRWYTKGYRYPIFETVRNVNISDSTEIFSTAFFFPPQEHLYIDTDTKNMALLEEMWDMENEKKIQEEQAKMVAIDDILICKIYPNPVETNLHLEYTMKQDAKVSFELYSIDGMLIRGIKSKQLNVGTYTNDIDCMDLTPRVYILKISANNISMKEVIIKK